MEKRVYKPGQLEALLRAGADLAARLDGGAPAYVAGTAAPLSGLPMCGGCGRRCESEAERANSWRALFGLAMVPAGPILFRVVACSGECIAAAMLRADAERWPRETHQPADAGRGDTERTERTGRTGD